MIMQFLREQPLYFLELFQADIFLYVLAIVYFYITHLFLYDKIYL